MGTKTPNGFIVVKTEGERTFGLTRRTGKHPPRWAERQDWSGCFVHSARSIIRAVRRDRQWTKEAEKACAAVYNPQTDSAEVRGQEVQFSALVARLCPERSNDEDILKAETIAYLNGSRHPESKDICLGRKKGEIEARWYTPIEMLAEVQKGTTDGKRYMQMFANLKDHLKARGATLQPKS